MIRRRRPERPAAERIARAVELVEAARAEVTPAPAAAWDAALSAGLEIVDEALRQLREIRP